MAATHTKQVSDVTRGWDGASGVRNELKRLPDLLGGDEQLINVHRAECTGRRGLLALTNARLLFLRERLFKSEVDEYPLEEVRALHLAQQFFSGPKLVLDLDNGQVEFKKVDAVRGSRIVEYVQARSSTEVHVPPQATPQDIDELKRSLGAINRVGLYGAYRRLRDVLEGGESLGPGTYATLDKDGGLLLATDRRLVFISNNSAKPVAAWRYRDVGRIEQPDAGTLVLLASARRTEFSSVDAGRGEPIVVHVRPRLKPPEKAAKRVDEALKTATKPKPARSAPPPPPKPSTPPRRPGRVDVNGATATELSEGLGLDRATAERAVALRTERGAFRSVDEFATLLALPPHVLRVVREAAVAESTTVREAPRRPGDIDIG